jgi:hypothetical protein
MALGFNHLKVNYLIFTSAVIFSTILPLNGGWFFNRSSHKKFPQIENFSEVAAVFDACDKNTFVTFDIDNTLIMSNDVLANFEFPSLWFDIQALFKYPELIWNQNLMEEILGDVFEQSQRFVFDHDIVSIIKELQKRNVPAVALSLMWSGACGSIKNMPEWRANMLNNFGINFDGHFPDTILTSLPIDRGQYPCLYKGILCTNQVDKGKVLGAFLDHNKLKPTHIISFDDQKKQLKSVAKECARRNIVFSGYQMVGWKKYCGQWDTDRALLQLDFLMDENLWLTDNQADAILADEASSASSY